MFFLLTILLGHRVLRLFVVKLDSDAEHLLCCAAIGAILVEVLLFFVQLSRHIRIWTGLVLGLVLLAGISEARPVADAVCAILGRIRAGSKLTRILAGVTALVVFLEGLAAMAPVTGSDALHYHFTAPLRILQSGFHPDFFLAHSFFMGQGHLLILAGLSLGSSQLAMGLLCLGGLLAAAAGACVARRWVGAEWAWTTALAFLLTPVVFWQISTAGAPDLWMAFFATTGAIVISESRALPPRSGSILAGALAGAVAGTKYTGCIIAAAMVVAYVWETRSGRKVMLFLTGATSAGIYPYLRNLVWSGDPFFPFLMPWISPAKVNAFALASYLADTGAGNHKNLCQIVKFPFFAAIDPAHLGFWQFLGPLVLAFSPLLVFVVRNTPEWRVSLIVWVLSALGIGLSSGMLRFLLPVLPIALAATVAVISYLAAGGSRAVRYVTTVTLAGALLFGGGAFLMYSRSALAVATGFSSQDAYLHERVQEYSIVDFVNQLLGGRSSDGLTAVFVRHVFYLRVPFLNCNPESSWAIDPTKFQSPQEWLTLFRRENVRWVVRSGEFPREVDAPFEEMIRTGDLRQIGEAEVADFQGLRISGNRVSFPVTVFEISAENQNRRPTETIEK